jgi:HK97 family phage major capsid protein
MALKAKDLRHKAKQNQARMQEILASSNESLSKEQEQEFDKLDTEAETLLKQADKIEKMQAREIAEDSANAEELARPVNKSIDDLKPEELKKAEDIAMRSYLKSGIVPVQLQKIMPAAQAEKDDNAMINKALKEIFGENFATQTTTTTAGGYTIARGFQKELEKALLEFGGMWESSRIIKTSQGNVMDWPTTNDTANKAYLLAESVSAATSAQAVVFGQQQFEAYKYTSGLIQVPTELLEDSEFDIQSLMVELLAERIWRGTNEAFTIADGSSKPKGITVGAAYAASTANDSALAFDDIINLEHSVDPAYRKMSKFMFHDSVLKALKKLKDGQNLPIWNPSILQNGAPGKILGYDYVINQDMASFVDGSASANDGDKVMLFGDLKKYIIRQVRNMRIVRLNERYGELDQTAFVVFFRVDGDLLNGGTNPVKFLKVSTT